MPLIVQKYGGSSVGDVGRIKAIAERVARARADGYDVVVDGTDNFANKYLINDLCLEADVPLVHAGAAQFRGQVMVVRRGGPCLRCLLPTPPDAATDECRFTGVFGPAVGTVAALAASEALRVLAGEPGGGGVVMADLAHGRLSRASLQPLDGCVCA